MTRKTSYTPGMAQTALLVMAAGMGSRYGGIKQVDPVGPGGESILEYSIFDARRAGFDRIVFLIRSAIEADFRSTVLERLPSSLHRSLAFQELDSLLGPEDRMALAASGRTKPWGTSHAILCAASELDIPFAAINADDFYGRETFRVVHDFLAARGPDSREWCMAGFRLRNTTSPNGTVSRGLCSLDERGMLSSVTEHTAISEDGFVSSLPDGSSVSLDGQAHVSMNFWGLTPAVFGLAEPLFRRFMEANRRSPKAEFYLPALVDLLIKAGEASVAVLPTPESWFGLTYKEDAPEVRRRIEKLGSEGLYPRPLWSRG